MTTSPGSFSVAPSTAVTDLRMRYGTADVLMGVSFNVAKGEVVALLGPNGAGKSTTIEILEGVRRRSGGEVSVLGADPEIIDEQWRARVGMVMQSWRDHARWSPHDLVEYLGRLYDPYAAVSGRPRWATEELLKMVGLDRVSRQKIRTLSGGERRRLDIAIGVIGRPEVLFLDEPTAGLDPEGRRDVHELIHGIVDRDDTAVLLTTHDLDEAGKIADRILVLAGGRIVADGSADALAASLARDVQIRWTHGGRAHVHACAEATGFVRQLLTGPAGADVKDLEVSRPTLEETYLALVATHHRGANAPLDEKAVV
ncbi:ABC transporter ATP-binding protein [Demequina sp.]|uniref:ABC transporter ATP-binding protein n=1 Tax=Demequina sp. TaxID=2050685 RepID=UPI0025C4EDCD|nr:ABC transporter ATP-binding protein [Demequina sp.]